MSNHFFPLTVSGVQQVTRDTLVASFSIPNSLAEQFTFIQGQHLTLRALVEGEDLRRSYSICSAVGDPSLRVAIKRVAGGRFSNWANDHLKSGSVVDVMPPMGRFNFPINAKNPRRYLAFAAGSGITPVLSILKTTLAGEPGSSFTLVYGNRATSAVIFREELAELKDLYAGRLSLLHVMSREPQDIDLFHGRIDAQKCRKLFEQWIDVSSHDAAFVCGPEQMMREVSDALVEAGMAKESIKVEMFGAAPTNSGSGVATRPAVNTKECEVTIVADGSHRLFTMAMDQESVLDAALKNGIDIRYSCKGGVCATCRCKVMDGKVEMDANYALEDYEIARGFVLSCQAFPVSDSLVLDFDLDS